MTFTTTFIINRKSILFAAIFIPITLLLGNWQLNRGNEKSAIFSDIKQNQQQQAVNLTDEVVVENYNKVLVQGKLHNDKSFLLDNQVYSGKGGYQLLTPLRLSNDSWILINRGWIKAPSNRNELPVIDTASYQTTIEGSIYYPKPYTLNDKQLVENGWPKRIQTIDIDLLSTYFAEPLFAYTIRIHPDSPWAYDADWEIQIIPPERHYGYAFQWFALSLVLFIMTVLTNTNLKQLFTRKPN